jgi:RNA polymerase sigma-70 factor (ECF subfamily)
MKPGEPGEHEELTSGISMAVHEECRDRLHRYILRLTHNPAKTDALVQETSLSAFRRLQSSRAPVHLSVCLYRIATGVCYDRFRRQHPSRAARPLDIASDEDEIGPPEDVDTLNLLQVIERGEMRARICKFIRQLRDDYRAVIFLHDLHGMTNSEIAQTLGCSLATVKIRLHRARQRLKAALTASERPRRD